MSDLLYCEEPSEAPGSGCFYRGEVGCIARNCPEPRRAPRQRRAVRELARGTQALATVQQCVSDAAAAVQTAAAAAQARDTLIHDAAGGSRADVIWAQQNWRDQKY